MTIRIVNLTELNGLPYLPKIMQRMFNSGAKGSSKITSTLCGYCFEHRRVEE